jgi:hypothetical protein
VKKQKALIPQSGTKTQELAKENRSVCIGAFATLRLCEGCFFAFPPIPSQPIMSWGSQLN